MKKSIKPQLNSGFTLLELLVVIGIIAILAGALIAALNPARQFALTRNTQRWANVTAILNAIGQNIAANTGTFTCAAGTIPASSTLMATGPGNYDLASCLVPTYLPTMPFDPSAAGAHYTSNTDYNTGYYISVSSTSNRITVSAPTAELGQTISATR